MDITMRKTSVGLKYLSFILNNEEYCIEILRVKEIMGITEITEIPQTPKFIKGVINLRGKIIPILDLRSKFEMQTTNYTDRTCIVVVEFNYEEVQSLMGLVVDAVKEVLSIPEEKISQVPYINSKIQSDFIKGIAEIDGNINIILDIIKILKEDDFVLLKNIDKGQIKPTNEDKEK